MPGPRLITRRQPVGPHLRPRHRQILFSVGSGISFAALHNKMPTCADLETLVIELLQNGFMLRPKPSGCEDGGGRGPTHGGSLISATVV